MSNLIVWLIVGGIAGFLASKVLSGRGMGVPMDIVVGIIGAFIGGFLATQAGISLSAGIIGDIAVAFVGAVVLLLVVRLVFKGGKLRHV
jgi:uncharacterized membrane protein YeaQ/YmgE (transglycosylase-associated protein family)